MLVDKIEELRKKLNQQGEKGSLTSDSILATSQKLDELILEYYRTERKKIDSTGTYNIK